MSKRILFVLTSLNKTLSGAESGWYLPEASHPYYELIKKYEVDFASPKGPNPPVDPGSVLNFKDDAKFLEDETVKQKLATAKKLEDVNVDDYDAIFYVGGHPPVIDLPEDQSNITLASEFWKQGKIVSAVCHGPGALVNVKDANGKSIFDGRDFACFTDDEERLVDTVQEIPFLVEERITLLGGKVKKAAPWEPSTVRDGQLITGQNPASALGVAKLIDEALSG